MSFNSYEEALQAWHVYCVNVMGHGSSSLGELSTAGALV